MPLRFLMKYLANNEQLVQRIAESYPVRRAAQMCVSIFYRTQAVAKDKLPPIEKIDSLWIRSFINRFKKNITEGIQDAKQQLKDNEKRK